MLFTSLEFIFLFLPIVIIINLILPKSLKNFWLFLASLFFYAWGEPFFVLVMMGTIGLNYLFALVIEKSGSNVTRRLLLALDIALNLGILFVYKYMNFVTSIFNYFNSDVKVTEFVLPIGISFYTFQALSYVVDVYRGEKAQKNIVHVGLYIALFPQLIAGPIVRYGDISRQLTERRVTFEGFCDGMVKFLIGFNKKMLIANILSIVADHSFNSDSRTVFLAWLGAVCYTLQIFFDFSGYSDMAIGLGKLMGFKLPKNFDYPYISKTVTEFWRRWHMSLGQWFRDYLYFPLGGSRVKGRGRLIFNLMFVWLMTGIWHGANMTFILWGVMYGVLISIEKLMAIPAKVEENIRLRVVYQAFTMLMVVLGWVLFRAESLSAAAVYIGNMFGLRDIGIASASDVFYLREYGIYIIAGTICSVPVAGTVKSKIQSGGSRMYAVADIGMYLANIMLFLIGVSYLVISAHNPFIYFNF